MQIFTFLCSDPDCPSNSRVIARIRMEFPAKGGGYKLDWSPVFLHGSSEQEARERMQAWYDEQIRKEGARQQHYRTLADNRKVKSKIQKVTLDKKDLPKIRKMTEEEAAAQYRKDRDAIRGIPSPPPSLRPPPKLTPPAPAPKPGGLVPPKKKS